MQKINFDNYQTKKSNIKSDRALIISEFLTKINEDRGKYPPVTVGRLAKMFAGVSTHDLRVFYHDCEYASNFSSYFWFKSNPKNYIDGKLISNFK